MNTMTRILSALGRRPTRAQEVHLRSAPPRVSFRAFFMGLAVLSMALAMPVAAVTRVTVEDRWPKCH
jgi:hypothetical protein